MDFPVVHTCAELMQLIGQIGFLPLLDSGIDGFSAEEIVGEECRYYTDPEDGFVWQLWKWKGQIVTEMGCLYGKVFNRKAGFVGKEWIADLCNYRRSRYPYPAEGSIEEAILDSLRMAGPMITRELRAVCGFNGTKMRGKFDSFVTRLEMGTYIVTEDFVYPRDRHNREYGWGWSLLNTPESLFGEVVRDCTCPPTESFERIYEHLRTVLPSASDRQIKRLIG